jgi:hypothetical protein
MPTHKNIQIIDSALNCAYGIFSVNEIDFREIFPEEGQDIEFVEDFFARAGTEHAKNIQNRLWSAPMNKKEVEGIHGTLFYGMEFKKQFYPTKKESEMVPNL